MQAKEWINLFKQIVTDGKLTEGYKSGFVTPYYADDGCIFSWFYWNEQWY